METKCVVIDSEETYKKVVAYYDKLGLKTIGGAVPSTIEFERLERHYKNQEVEYVLYYDENNMMFSQTLSGALRDGLKIVSVEEYTGQPRACLECGGTGVYVGFLKTEPCSLCCGGKS